MVSFDWKRELAREGHKVILSGQPVAMHCHHYNINLQKTIEDNLGRDAERLLFQSVEEASYRSFQDLFQQYPQIKTVKSKLEMAGILFQNCGLGVLHFKRIRPGGGGLKAPPATMSPAGLPNTANVTRRAAILPGGGPPGPWKRSITGRLAFTRLKKNSAK